MAGYFADLFNTGSSCAFRQSPFRLALQAVFCIGCSPKSADYVDYNSTSGMAELRVCRAMAEQLDPAFYDDCGLVRSNGRGDSCATSQVIVPSYHYGEGLDGALQLLNDDGGGKPPFYSGFNVTIVDSDDLTICFVAASARRAPPPGWLFASSMGLIAIAAAQWPGG